MKKLQLLLGCIAMGASVANAQTTLATINEMPYPGAGFDYVLRTGNTNCHTGNAMPIPVTGQAASTFDMIAYTWDPGTVSAGNPYNWGIAFGEVVGGSLSICFMNFAHHNVFTNWGALSANNAWCGADVALVKSDDGVNPRTYAVVSYYDPVESRFKIDRLRFLQNLTQGVAEIDEVKTYVLDHVVNSNNIKSFTHIDAIKNEKFIVSYTNPDDHKIHFVTGNTSGGTWVIDQQNSSGVIQSATFNYPEAFDDYPDIAMSTVGGSDDFTSYTCTNTAKNKLYVFTNKYHDIVAAGPGGAITPYSVDHYNGSNFEFPRIDCPDMDNNSPGTPSWTVVAKSNYGDINAYINDAAQGSTFLYTLNDGSMANAQPLNTAENFNPVVSYESDNTHLNFAWVSADPTVNSTPTTYRRFIGMQIDASGNSVTPGYWDASASPGNNSNGGGKPAIALSGDNTFNNGQLMAFNYTDNATGVFDMYYKIVPWANGSFKPGNNTGIKGNVVSSQQMVNAAPNPFRQSFALQMLDKTQDHVLSVSVIGIDGKMVKAFHGTVQQINTQLNDYGQKLATGVYVLKVRGQSIDQTIKMVKE